MTFQHLSHFQPISSRTDSITLPQTPKLEPKIATKTQEVDNKTLEDWSHRIETCAYEAEDEGLKALSSDLLDLRDEVVALLHKNV